MRLQDREVVVVGGSSGIGLGVAAAALRAGARVVLVSRTQERLERAAAGLRAPGRVRTVAADATREGDVLRLFEAVPSLDHLVVTAADVRYGPLREAEVEAVRCVLDSKLLAPVLLAKHGASRIREGGSITLTAGIAAERPIARGGSMVAAVNGALFALARALALELAPVRVNTVSPGWVDTPIWGSIAGVSKTDAFAALAPRLPGGRIGTPSDVGHAVVFLMENAHMTGAVLPIDGGQRLV